MNKTDTMYTMQDWKRDGTLNLSPGQKVSDEIVRELIGCVPPAHLGGGLFQCGEPACTETKTFKTLYDTYREDNEGWTYLGHCRLGETIHRESFEEAYLRERREREKAAGAIPEQTVGELVFTDRSGERKTPGLVYFAMGYNRTPAGQAYCHYDNALCPVSRLPDGKALCRPEWAGLEARFQGGKLFNFRNAN